MYTYSHPRPSIAVDIVIIRKVKSEYQVLLIMRAQEPYQGCYALPGGFVDIDETLEDAAARELLEETGIKVGHLHQVQTFSAVNRDPRGRVISTAFFGLVFNNDAQLVAGSDASNVSWISLDNLPKLAFDHAKIIQLTISKMDFP